MAPKTARKPGIQPPGRDEVDGFLETQWEPTAKCQICKSKGGKTKPMRYTPCRNSQICWPCEVNDDAVSNHLAACKGLGCVNYLKDVREGLLPPYKCPQNPEALAASQQQLQAGDDEEEEEEGNVPPAQAPRPAPKQAKGSRNAPSGASTSKPKAVKHLGGPSQTAKGPSTEHQDDDDSDDDRDTLSDDSSHEHPKSLVVPAGRAVYNPDIDLQSGNRMSDSRPPEYKAYWEQAETLFDNLNDDIRAMCDKSYLDGESHYAGSMRRKYIADTLFSLRDTLDSSRQLVWPGYWLEQEKADSLRRGKGNKRPAQPQIEDDDPNSSSHQRTESMRSSPPAVKRQKTGHEYAFLAPRRTAQDESAASGIHVRRSGSFRREVAQTTFKLPLHKHKVATENLRTESMTSSPTLPKASRLLSTGTSSSEHVPAHAGRRASSSMASIGSGRASHDPSPPGHRRMTGIREALVSSPLARRGHNEDDMEDEGDHEEDEMDEEEEEEYDEE